MTLDKVPQESYQMTYDVNQLELSRIQFINLKLFYENSQSLSKVSLVYGLILKVNLIGCSRVDIFLGVL